jgi:REase_DpnII-MboI
VTTEWREAYLDYSRRVKSIENDKRVSPFVIASPERYTIEFVISVLYQFDACLRYLKSRSRTSITVSDEYQLQDFIFLMTKPVISDLVPEEPNPRIASRFTIDDFVSKKLALILEAKYIRDRAHGKSISKELHDDIEMYRTNEHCSTIIFFIYDPGKFIPSAESLVKHIETKRTYDKKILTTICIVKS